MRKQQEALGEAVWGRGGSSAASHEQELTGAGWGWGFTLTYSSGGTTQVSLYHNFKQNICVSGTLLSLRYPQLFYALA